MTSRQGVGGHLAFATPRDWFPVPLPQTDADVDQLVSQIGPAVPELADKRGLMKTMLSGLIEAAATVNAVCAYAAMLHSPGPPLPATLLVSVPAIGDSTLDQLATAVSDPDDAAASSHMETFDLPAGPTVRVERLLSRPGTADGQPQVSFNVKYVTEVLGRGQAVVMAFAAPAAVLTESLRPLFHQIACTLCVNPEGPVDPPGGHNRAGDADPVEAY